ncbi:hypothetical protein MCOR24_005406 [Pyricularia oryzae]|nr:hypothetical protein MCOR24_005406 [Pyricularia oryzae]
MHDDGAFQGPLKPSRKETNPAADGWGLCAMPTRSYVYAPGNLQRSLVTAPRVPGSLTAADFPEAPRSEDPDPTGQESKGDAKNNQWNPLASCELARWGDNFELISIAMSQMLDPSIAFCTTVGFRLSPTTQPSGYVVGQQTF